VVFCIWQRKWRQLDYRILLRNYWYLSHRTRLVFWALLNGPKSPPDFDIDWAGKNEMWFWNTFLIVMGTKMWLLWYECRIQIPFYFREVGKVFIYQKVRPFSKNPMRFQQSNSVVKEVQEYVIRKYPNAACIPVSSYQKSLLRITHPLKCLKGFPIVLLICMWKLLVLRIWYFESARNWAYWRHSEISCQK
jgi:hypothetical protein